MMDLDTTPPDRSLDRISPGKSTEPIGQDRISSPSSDFESYMQTGSEKSSVSGATPGAGAGGPLEMGRGPAMTGSPTLDSLTTQAKNAQDTLGTIGEQLNTPNLKLKRAQTHLLKNKLQDANSYIRSAGSKLGVEAPPMKPPSSGSPLDRFIAYVNDGQNQLLAVQDQLKSIAAKGDEIRPVDLLSIQVKMNLAQQEIEYSSTLLGKVIDSIKQIMNIQL